MIQIQLLVFWVMYASLLQGKRICMQVYLIKVAYINLNKKLKGLNEFLKN